MWCGLSASRRSCTGRVGGGSGDLGIALAIATVLETPVVMLYATYRARAKSSTWLIIAAASFLLKSICLLFARSVLAIMLIQVLQFCSFGLYVPTSVFYAREQVSLPDMVKGQAMITAAYALGCSMGSFLGGRLLDLGGVQSLLFSGVGLAAVALIILVFSTKKIERIQKT